MHEYDHGDRTLKPGVMIASMTIGLIHRRRGRHSVNLEPGGDAVRIRRG
jgi:hypothetical protein